MKQTTLCYIDDGERYLMLHRTKKAVDASHDKWIGVGGKCEATESPDECMLREVKEETGLEIDRWHYRGIVTFISDTWPNEYMHLFTADRWHGDIISVCNEGDLEWVNKTHIEKLNLWEGDKIFLRLLAEPKHDFFSLKLVYVADTLTLAILNGKLLPLPQK
ncbi:MAG: 8-oxo-dGTP diphosphatase [Bacteroidales bacterium]|nr:8-oxo-dGTP diphosphatase [Bacteroidales bacterium]